jgi:hypothetical protein
VPPRWALGGTWAATYAVSPSSATPPGGAPVGTARITWPVAGSSSVSVAEPALATQTWPSAATAIPLGCLPTGKAPSRWPLEGSIFDTVPSAPLATHTASGPTATAAGSFTLVVPATVRAAGSMRERTPYDCPITQTKPSPAAMPSAPPSTEIGGPGIPVTGSIRITVRSAELATHTAPRP